MFEAVSNVQFVPLFLKRVFLKTKRLNEFLVRASRLTGC